MLLAVSLTNDPPTTPDELTARCLAAGVVDHPGADAADLATVLDLLDTWRAIVDAPDVATRVARLNALLAASTAHPRLSDHAGGWHIHYRHDALPLGGILRALFATGTALHLTGRGMHRLGRCAAEGCDRVYADVSRTGRQRYCSPRCANRDAVRRHRAAPPTPAAPPPGRHGARSALSAR